MDWNTASAELAKPLDSHNVSSRQQAGRKLSYIEGWYAIAEANRIFGFDGWTRETVDIKCVAERERKVGTAGRDGWSVSYTAKVRVTVSGVVREGVGAGHGIDVDLGLAHESASKEAETDAMKRALMTFGNPFGLALYDKTQANVGDGNGKAPSAPEKPQETQQHRPVSQPAPRQEAPPAPSQGSVFATLEQQLRSIEDAGKLDMWVGDAQAAKAAGKVTSSEWASLRSLHASRVAFLAQGPSRSAA